ncbi:Holliday junction resolvase RecU [Salsuginibacillus kocurii]|uniref:Holliday junction resolvase RecU n=1 Tax=Salsuginibacillus kocurii TaxID=427078 RepID=UPI003B84ADF0
MTLKYPNGKAYNKQTLTTARSRHTSNKQRGMTLEEDINTTIKYYREAGRALIHKKPVPIQVVNVNYPSRSRAKITEAYFRQPSTTDYHGIYRGRSIDFEAKETHSKTSFPFKNIHPHQVEHLKSVEAHGGIGCLIIGFDSSQEIYLVPASIFIPKYEDQSQRKSLSIDLVRNEGVFIERSYAPPLKVLEAIDTLYF